MKKFKKLRKKNDGALLDMCEVTWSKDEPSRLHICEGKHSEGPFFQTLLTFGGVWCKISQKNNS